MELHPEHNNVQGWVFSAKGDFTSEMQFFHKLVEEVAEVSDALWELHCYRGNGEPDMWDHLTEEIMDVMQTCSTYLTSIANDRWLEKIQDAHLNKMIERGRL